MSSVTSEVDQLCMYSYCTRTVEIVAPELISDASEALQGVGTLDKGGSHSSCPIPAPIHAQFTTRALPF